MPDDLRILLVLAIGACVGIAVYRWRKASERANAPPVLDPEPEDVVFAEDTHAVYDHDASMAALQKMRDGGFDMYVSVVSIYRSGKSKPGETLVVTNDKAPYVHHMVKRSYRSGWDVARIEIFANDHDQSLLRVLDDAQLVPEKSTSLTERDPSQVYRGIVTVGRGQGEAQEWRLSYYM